MAKEEIGNVPSMTLDELITLLQNAKMVYGGNRLITTLVDSGDDTQYVARVNEVKIEALREFIDDDDDLENRFRYQFHESLLITGFDVTSFCEKNDSVEL